MSIIAILLIILTLALIVFGVIFSVAPPIPGPILSYGAFITVHYASVNAGNGGVATSTFIVFGVITALILLADTLIPAYATKASGGTNAGIWGGMIGAIVGMVSGIPYGIILGPLVGAIIGDLYGGKQFQSALKSGFASFVGFLIATLLKIIASVVMGVWVLTKVMVWVGKDIIHFFANLF